MKAESHPSDRLTETDGLKIIGSAMVMQYAGQSEAIQKEKLST
ncbi:hypothetical protein [Endozoicomonas sp.]